MCSGRPQALDPALVSHGRQVPAAGINCGFGGNIVAETLEAKEYQ